METRDVLKGLTHRYGYTIVFKEGLEEDLKSKGVSYELIKIKNNMGSITVPTFDDLAVVRNSPFVEFLVDNNPMVSLGDASSDTSSGINAIDDIGAKFFHENPYINLTGKGVLIAIIDGGIDYLHPDFIYPDQTSKIVAIWDQTINSKPPKNYLIGSEYTNEDINKAIKENNPNLSKDEDSTGTLVAGIAAGMGNVNKNYKGVAPDASLIVVKLQKTYGVYTDFYVRVASEYVQSKAAELNMPIIILGSIGSNFGAGLVANGVRSIRSNRGIVFISGCGNEGDTQTHNSGQIKNKGDIKEINLEISDMEEDLELELWVDRPDKIDVAITSPSGETSKWLTVRNNSAETGIFTLEDTPYSIFYYYPGVFSGRQYVRFKFQNIKKGIWTIKLRGQYIITGTYNLYLPNRKLLKPDTKFSESDPFKTCNFPSIYEQVISVGAYNSINKSLWQSSSRGPNIDNNQNPILVAPGVNIISTYPGGKYGKITGTAAACAHVVGAVAMYFQYTIVEGRYPNQAHPIMVSSYLSIGAKRGTTMEYPNPSYGYGILDIKGMFNQFR